MTAVDTKKKTSMKKTMSSIVPGSKKTKTISESAAVERYEGAG